MDPIILSQKSKKWFDAVKNLKDHIDELDLSEQTAIDFLNDAWRTRSFDSDLIREAREMTQILIHNQKLHGANRKIIEWTKELCSTSDLMYTRDAKTYDEVRSALRKTWQESRPKPAPKPNPAPRPNSGATPKPAPRPTTLDPIILAQKAKKWAEGGQFLVNNESYLSNAESQALLYLLTEWQTGKYNQTMPAKAKEMCKIVRDSQKLHTNNRKIIEWTKEICNTAELLYTRDEQTFIQVGVALYKALQENPIVAPQPESKPQPQPQPKPQPQPQPKPNPTPPPPSGNSGYRPTGNNTTSYSGGSRRGGKKKGDIIAKGISWFLTLAIFGWVFYTCSGGGKGETMYSVGDVHLVDSKGKAITTIPGPAKVELLDMEDGKAKIKADGKKGYVDARYIMTADESKRLEYVINHNQALATDFGRKAIHDFITNNPSIVNNPGNWRIYNTSETTVPKAVMQPKPSKSDVREVLAFVVASEGRYQRGVYHLLNNGEIVRVMNQQVPVGDLLSTLTYNGYTGKYDIHYAKDDKIVTPAKIKPTAGNPFLITDISFVTVDGNSGKVISRKVTTQSEYVSPVINYVAKPDGHNKRLLVKVFDPTGKLIRESSSPEDGTYYTTIEHWQIKPKGELTLTGWRNTDKSIAWERSGYRIEIWDGDSMLASGKVTVK